MSKSKIKKTAKKAAKRRQPKRLSHTLYSYVEPTNGKYAREFGKRHFGSFSAYVDTLIAIDRKRHFSQAKTTTVAKKKLIARPKTTSIPTQAKAA